MREERTFFLAERSSCSSLEELMYLFLVASRLSVRFLAIVRFLFRPDVGRQVAVVVLWQEVSPTLGRTPTGRCKASSLVVPWAAKVAERAHVQVEGVTRPAAKGR